MNLPFVLNKLLTPFEHACHELIIPPYSPLPQIIGNQSIEVDYQSYNSKHAYDRKLKIVKKNLMNIYFLTHLSPYPTNVI